MQELNNTTKEQIEDTAQKTSSMQCEECNKEIKEKPICQNCYAVKKIQHMWELEKLERVKKIIDEILKLDKIENGKGNPYDPHDYSYLFAEDDEDVQ